MKVAAWFIAIAVSLGLVCGFVIGRHAVEKVNHDEIQAARRVGYEGGYREGARVAGWIVDNCSELGSGDISLIVCKAGSK